MVHIGFGEIEGKGWLIHNPEKSGRAWFYLWRTTIDKEGHIQVEEEKVVKMSIGDEAEMGGIG